MKDIKKMSPFDVTTEIIEVLLQLESMINEGPGVYCDNEDDKEYVLDTIDTTIKDIGDMQFYL